MQSNPNHGIINQAEVKHMNTHIQLGIVLRLGEYVIQELEHILDVVEIFHKSVTISHPKDGDYTDWIEEVVEGDLYSMIDKLSYRNAYADIIFDINGTTFDTQMKTTLEGDEMVVSFDVFTSQLELSVNELDKLFTKIFEVLDRNVEHYEYMYCDNEAEYLYTKQRIMELGFVPYSMLKYNSRDTVFAQWHVDGFTLRD